MGGKQSAHAAAGPRRLVAIDKVTGRGSLPVSRRYTSSRPLEADYILESKVLGCGMNGPVRLVKGRRDAKPYAVKTFDKRGRYVEEFRNEAEIYLSLDHPHVAHLEMVYEAERQLHLVMEYMGGGELYDRLAERRRCSEATSSDAMHQMLLAVAYLHTHKIAHRDLKLENFMYESEETNHLKLIDFGFAKHTDNCGRMSQSCGSLHYVAPEVLARSYTEKADIWSMGIIAYMLLTGNPVFSGTDNDILRKIKAGHLSYCPRFYSLSPAARDFVQALLVVDPYKRLSAQQALEHPWIAERLQAAPAPLDLNTLESLRSFSRASQFQRTVLSMMACCLSAEELAELRKQFLQMDADKNGTISLQELKDVLARGFQVGGKEAEEMFRCIDTDENNEIEYNEFLAVAVQGRAAVHEDMLRETFARFDADGDGLITRGELRSALGDAFSQDEVADVLEAADTSGDGNLDFDEFIAFFKAAGDAEGRRSLPEREKRRSQIATLLSPSSRRLSLGDAPASPPEEGLSALRPAPPRRKADSFTPTCFPNLTWRSGAGSDRTRTNERNQMPVLLTSIRAGRPGKAAGA